MSNCDDTSTLTAAERTFSCLWRLTGARPLVGYEASLLATIAKTDLPSYHNLTAVDLDDCEAVKAAVTAIQSWRRDVAAGGRRISFGPRQLRKST
jgi:hypothetical protein